MPQAEWLEDSSVDIPQIWSNFAQLSVAAAFTKDDIVAFGEKIDLGSEPKTPPKEKLMEAFEKASSA
jgi:hypothetical protein